VRPGHPLAARDDIMLRDLADYPLGSPSLWELDGWAAPSALAQIACDDSAALKELALTTDTVLLGMRLAMEPELAQNRLVALPTRLLSGPSRVGVVERRGRSRSASASRLIGEFDKALAPFAVEPEPGDGPAGSP
jgi:DNA-binding transcriptional LysR family regulator